MKNMKRLLAIFLLHTLLVPALAVAADGKLDKSFGGGDGWVDSAVSAEADFKYPVDFQFTTALHQRDGKLVTLGMSTMWEGLISRHLPSGAPDPTFNGNGKVVIPFSFVMLWPTSMIQQQDGKLLVSGGCMQNMVEQRACLFRLLGNGELDVAFASSGFLYYSQSVQFTALLQQADGKLLAAAETYDGSGLLFRFGLDGSPDMTFGSLGRVPFERTVSGIFEQPGGKILVAGADLSGAGTFMLKRFTATGELDNSFFGNGEGYSNGDGYDGRPDFVVPLANGQLLLAGSGSMTGGADMMLMRLSADGVLDTTFGSSGRTITDVSTLVGSWTELSSDGPFSVIELPSKQLLLAGIASDPGSGNHLVLMRYSKNGQLDTSFGTNGVAEELAFEDGMHLAGGFRALYTSRDNGKIVLFGMKQSCNWELPATCNWNLQNAFLRRYDVHGQRDSNWGINGTIEVDFSYYYEQVFGHNVALLQQSDGKLVNGGRAYVTRYHSDGTPDTGFNNTFLTHQAALLASGNYTVRGLLQQPDEKLLAFTDIGMFRLDTDGSLDSTFSDDGLQEVIGSFPGNFHIQQWNDVVLMPDGKILAAVNGYLHEAGGNSGEKLSLLRFNADGNLDTAFGSDGLLSFAAEGDMRADHLIRQTDGKWVTSGVAGYGGDVSVVRFNTDGQVDTSFNTQGYIKLDFGPSRWEHPGSLLQLSDGKLLVASSVLDAAERHQLGLARLNTDGSVDTAFGNAGKVVVDGGLRWKSLAKMAQDASGKILVLGMRDGFTPRPIVVRFNQDGSFDTTFGKNGVMALNLGEDAEATAMFLTGDGKALVSGSTIDADAAANGSFVARIVVESDLDRDGVVDRLDNCAKKSNANQADLDADGMGDSCDIDRDGDGISNPHDPSPDSP
jgi:uncharacterized delta-60 repeat protein